MYVLNRGRNVKNRALPDEVTWLQADISDADAVRLLVEQDRERPAAGFDLTGRPQLLAVKVPPPDLAVYGALTSAKGVKR